MRNEKRAAYSHRDRLPNFHLMLEKGHGSFVSLCALLNGELESNRITRFLRAGLPTAAGRGRRHFGRRSSRGVAFDISGSTVAPAADVLFSRGKKAKAQHLSFVDFCSAQRLKYI